MLKKTNRLRSQWDFKRTLAGARLCANVNFTLYVLHAQPSRSPQAALVGPLSPRIGFIVSKKVAKRATIRNKIKRRMREIFRLWLKSDEGRAWLEPYRTVVVIARMSSLDATYGDLKAQLEACFQKRLPPERPAGGATRRSRSGAPGSSLGRNRC
jgi:ribonuclease P protein component